MNLTKMDLTYRAAEYVATHYHKAKTLEQIKVLVDELISLQVVALTSGTSVALKNIGTLKVTLKDARPGRNPKTGEQHEVCARRVVTLSNRGDRDKCNYSTLFAALAMRCMIPDKLGKLVMDSYLDTLKELSETKDASLQIRGFGTFRVKTLPARMKRNPKTGETVTKPESLKLHFKQSKSIVIKDV